MTHENKIEKKTLHWERWHQDEMKSKPQLKKLTLTLQRTKHQYAAFTILNKENILTCI